MGGDIQQFDPYDVPGLSDGSKPLSSELKAREEYISELTALFESIKPTTAAAATARYTAPTLPNTSIGDISSVPSGIPEDQKSGRVPNTPTVTDLDPEGNRLNNIQTRLDNALRDLKPPDAVITQQFNNAWINRLNSSAVPHTGLNDDYTRKTGVNDVDHENTLRYARLVDAVNNRRYLGPAKGGSATLVRGNLVTTGNSVIGPGDIYKMDGLETPESKAYKRAEAAEELETKREISRTQDVKDMPSALERLAQLARLQQAGELTSDMRAEQKALLEAVLQNQYNLPYLMDRDRFNTQLGMTQDKYRTELEMFQNRYNTLLSMLQQRFSTALTEYIYRVTTMQIPIEKVDFVMHDPNYLSRGLHGYVLGTGAPDMQANFLWKVLQRLGVTDANNMTEEQMAEATKILEEAIRDMGNSVSDTALGG